MPVFYKQYYFDKYCFDTLFFHFTHLFQVDIFTFYACCMLHNLSMNVLFFYTSPSTLNLPNI